MADQPSPYTRLIQKAFSEGLQVKQVVESANKMFKALPDVMGSAITAAKIPDKDGHADRKMLFQIAGLFPEKGGLQISLNQSFSGLAPTANPAAGTHDLLHQDPFEDAIDVEVEEEDVA